MISCMGRGLGNVCEIRPVSDLNILVPRAILIRSLVENLALG